LCAIFISLKFDTFSYLYFTVLYVILCFLLLFFVCMYIKFVPVHATKAYRGRWGIVQLIQNLDIRWSWVFNFTHRPLYTRDSIPVPIAYEAGWTPESVWAFLRKEKCLFPAGFVCIYVMSCVCMWSLVSYVFLLLLFLSWREYQKQDGIKE
jgi:hypothetical protein